MNLTKVLIGVVAIALIGGGTAYSITPLREAVLGKPVQEQIDILIGEIEKLRGEADVPRSDKPTDTPPVRKRTDTNPPELVDISDRARIEKEVLKTGDWYEKYYCKMGTSVRIQGIEQEWTKELSDEIDRAGGCSSWQWKKFESDPGWKKMIDEYNALLIQRYEEDLKGNR